MKNLTELIKSQSDDRLLARYVAREAYGPKYARLFEEEVAARCLFTRKLGIEHPGELSENEIVDAIQEYLAKESMKEVLKEVHEREKADEKAYVEYMINMITLY